MGKKYAMIDGIVVGFASTRDLRAWLLVHPAARAVSARDFPSGRCRRDAVPSFLYDAISQDFSPEHAHFCLQSVWNDAGKKRQHR
ncbi:MAG: hypothetical protein HQL88_04640 [Magnetococcales bacterium]|nr:hypothetical protein [Magnetococcales bacterium]